MNILRAAFLSGFVACGFAAVAQSPPPTTFEGARWIWFSSEPMPLSTAQSFPGGVNYFRAGFQIADTQSVQSAECILTADNLFSLYLNGRLVGESEADGNCWGRPKRFDVASLLVPGRNVVAVEAVNTIPGPAGLIAKLVVQRAAAPTLVLVTDETWKSNDAEKPGWEKPAFDDKGWRAAHRTGDFGAAPWGAVAVTAAPLRGGEPLTDARRQTREALENLKDAARRGYGSGPQPVAEMVPPADYPWPEGVVFVGDDCSLYRPSRNTGTSQDSLSVTIFNPNHTRAFPEHDLPAPMKVGRKLFALTPARPGVTPRVLLDAGKGGLGSPSVSFDGRSIYVAMAREGDGFFHIYRLSRDGKKLQRLTDGPFHDIDPAELPDGRIVFTSTRIGTFEEYHNPPSRALFVMNSGGGEIRPLTHTFVFDNEPRVLADGRIIFIRSDNFFGRGKVETLLHAMHPDGTSGYTEFGLDLGPEYGGRLRAFNVGSPAPLPDGRVAFVTGSSIAIGTPGTPARDWRQLRVEASDVSALPDGRLLCVLPGGSPAELAKKRAKRRNADFAFEKLAIIDPNGSADRAVIVFDSPGEAIHSAVYLGPRPLPPLLAQKADPSPVSETRATGVLFCQNVRFTKNTTAGWPHVRAVRVLAGKGLTMRSSHSYIVHAGAEVTELGTVPLAPDGSFAVEVPADTAIAFQAVDAEGRSELNEMSWIYVRPGETRGCVGCHQSRQVTPPNSSAMMQAMMAKPLKLLGQGQPHRFRGNNAAVTGLMEMQFDRYREIAGINRHSDTTNALATGAEAVAALVVQLKGNEAGLNPNSAVRGARPPRALLDAPSRPASSAGDGFGAAAQSPATDVFREGAEHSARGGRAPLSASDIGLKISAAQRLAIFRAPAAAAALAENLRDASCEVRVASAMALATCGTRASVPSLLAALADAEPLVSQAAAVALENLTGSGAAWNAFVSADERKQQAQSLSAGLQKPDWNRIEQELVERLNSPDRDVVRRSAVALGHVGGAAAQAALRGKLASGREINPYPEWRKSHNGDGAMFNSLSPANPRTLQAVTRAIGCLQDAEAVPLLAETVLRYSDPGTGNLFLVEAAVEALGRIGTPAAEAALTNAFARLTAYPNHTRWYGDHDALIACHAAPLHYLIIEALDAMGSTQAGGIVPHLIRSVPTDTDRALLPRNDDCETLTGRVIRRSGTGPAVMETCLAILGDPDAQRTPEIAQAIATTHQAWGGKPDPENRAAQILSLTCRDRQYEPRIRAAFERYRALTNDIPRLFDTGIPVVTKLPVKHWVCFFLARSLGNLGDSRSTDALLAALEKSPPEAASGYPDPLGPGVLFLHNDLTPCWRAASAWALGRIGDPRAVPVLLKTVGDLQNATDTRYAAAEALAGMADAATLAKIGQLAADYPEVSTRRALLEIAAQTDTGRANGTR